MTPKRKQLIKTRFVNHRDFLILYSKLSGNCNRKSDLCKQILTTLNNTNARE